MTTGRDDLVGALAHELRTPLGTIRSWAHILRLNPGAQEQVRTAADVIERNAEQLAQLIGDFLDASRIAEGTLRLDVKAVSVAPIVAAAVGQVQPIALAKQVRLECEASGLTSDPVAADANRLGQAIRGLLAEAAKAAPREGRVQVSVRNTGQGVSIRITATGADARAFEEASPHAAPGAATREAPGIVFARRLIELQRGTLASDDEGATFTIVLAGAGTGS